MIQTRHLLGGGGLLSLLGVGVLTVTLFHTWSEWVGILALVGYGCGTLAIGTCIVYRSCFFQLTRTSTWILGALFAWSVVAIMLGLPIIFATMTPLLLTVMLLSAVLMLVCIAVVADVYREAPHPIDRGSVPGWYAIDMVRKHYVWLVLYGGIWLLGACSLIGVAETSVLLTPWHALPQMYVWSVAIGGLILVCLLFSRFSTSIVLGVIVLQSLLMHAYIPASHVLPVGGDIWRHIAMTEHVRAGNPINPVLFGNTATFEMVGPIVLPSVLVHPQKYAYAVQWGSMVLTEYVAPTAALSVYRWAMPLIWAIGIPILFFYLGLLLFRSHKHALVVSSGTLVSFALLSQGSILLPVTIGYLMFFIALLWLLMALRYGTRMQWTLVGLSAFGLLFVYPLHAILYAFVALAGSLLYRLRDVVHDQVRRGIVIILALVSILLLPSIELAAGYSTLPSHVSLIDTAKQIIGEHSGWYLATAIRPHDILSGNILFNHVPAAAFVPTVFTTHRWLLLLIAIGVYGCAAFGYVLTLIKEKRTSWQLLAILASSVWGAYGISWYLLDGERQLVRRLDILFAVLLVLFAWYGLTQLLHTSVHNLTVRKRITGVFALAIVLMWWGAMAAFTLGPDTRFVSTDEYAVGQYLATQDSIAPCVLADTWPLLTLEAASAGTIIGGNFAMDTQFAQPVRVALYDRARIEPTSTLWADIAQVMPEYQTCVLILPLDTPTSTQSYIQAYGTPTMVGSFGVWQGKLQRE